MSYEMPLYMKLSLFQLVKAKKVKKNTNLAAYFLLISAPVKKEENTFKSMWLLACTFNTV